MENELETIDKKKASEIITDLQDLVKDCPMVTQAEIRKLLSIQGFVLNTIGFEILGSVSNPKTQTKLLRIGFEAIAGSRSALSLAASIDPADKS